MEKKKLVVIGIDGGTFDIINPFIQQGLLPNLNKFVKRGILGSTMPPGTGVAWSSFSTGNKTEKTNIYDFTIVEDDSWKIKFVNRRILQGKTLWEYLNEAGLRSYFVNIPLSYPPDKINGVIVSGIDTPSTFSNYTHPPELKEKLKEFNYDIEVSGMKGLADLPDEAVRILDARLKTARHLIQDEFDFFAVLFRASDVVQHFAWGTDYVKEVYMKIDEFIGEVQDREDCELIVMSDHGHEKVDRAFNVNTWLEQEGYLSTKVKKKSMLSGFVNREKIFKILDSLNLNFMLKVIPRELGKKIPTKNVDFEEAIITGMVEMDKTKAIAKRAVKSSQIFLNKESRGGIVRKEDEDRLKREIKGKLLRYFTEKNLEVEIYTREELYGENTKYAPDITLYFKEKGYDTLSVLSPEKKLWDKTKEQATHNKDGIIFTDLDLKIEGSNIIDLCPTILDYFEIGKKDVDGKSLLDIS